MIDVTRLESYQLEIINSILVEYLQMLAKGGVGNFYTKDEFDALLAQAKIDILVYLEGLITPEHINQLINDLELATVDETATGVVDNKAITPHTLHERNASETQYGLIRQATPSELMMGSPNVGIPPSLISTMTPSTSAISVQRLATIAESSTGSTTQKVMTVGGAANLIINVMNEIIDDIAYLKEGFTNNLLVSPAVLKEGIDTAIDILEHPSSEMEIDEDNCFRFNVNTTVMPFDPLGMSFSPNVMSIRNIKNPAQNFKIYWGDGKSTRLSDLQPDGNGYYNVNHIFPFKSTIYDVVVTGAVEEISFSGNPILEIVTATSNTLKKFTGFYGCGLLTNICEGFLENCITLEEISYLLPDYAPYYKIPNRFLKGCINLKKINNGIVGFKRYANLGYEADETQSTWFWRPLESIGDDFLMNCTNLEDISLCQMLGDDLNNWATNPYLKYEQNITKESIELILGNNFMKDCINLKKIPLMFALCPIKNLPSSFLSGCSSLQDISGLFYKTIINTPITVPAFWNTTLYPNITNHYKWNAKEDIGNIVIVNGVDIPSNWNYNL